MSEKPHHLNARSPAGQPQRITDADEAHSADMHARTVKYTISMSVRLVCFIAAFFVHGWLQVVMLVLAVILPYFAVIVANAGGADLDKRSSSNYYDGGAPAALTGGGTAAPTEGNAGGAGNGTAGGTTAGTTGDAGAAGGGTAGTDASESDPDAPGSNASGSNDPGSNESGPDASQGPGQTAPQETDPASAEVLPGEWYEPAEDPDHPRDAWAGHRRKNGHRG